VVVPAIPLNEGAGTNQDTIWVLARNEQGLADAPDVVEPNAVGVSSDAPDEHDVVHERAAVVRRPGKLEDVALDEAEMRRALHAIEGLPSPA